MHAAEFLTTHNGETPIKRKTFFRSRNAAYFPHGLLDAWTAKLRLDLDRRDDLESRARVIVERMALALQASLLVRVGNSAVADAFCASRLGDSHGLCFGTLSAGVPFEALIERAFPA